MKEAIDQIVQKTEKLDKDIDKSVTFLHNINNYQHAGGFQIQVLKEDVRRVIAYREQLGHAIQFY